MDFPPVKNLLSRRARAAYLSLGVLVGLTSGCASQGRIISTGDAISYDCNDPLNARSIFQDSMPADPGITTAARVTVLQPIWLEGPEHVLKSLVVHVDEVLVGRIPSAEIELGIMQSCIDVSETIPGKQGIAISYGIYDDLRSVSGRATHLQAWAAAVHPSPPGRWSSLSSLVPQRVELGKDNDVTCGSESKSSMFRTPPPTRYARIPSMAFKSGYNDIRTGVILEIQVNPESSGSPGLARVLSVISKDAPTSLVGRLIGIEYGPCTRIAKAGETGVVIGPLLNESRRRPTISPLGIH